MQKKIKIAAVQIEPNIKARKANLEKVIAETKVAAQNGSDLIVFPECALTGYVFSSRKEALASAETIPGISTERIGNLCKGLGVYVVVGMIEEADGKCFNAAVFIGPSGLMGRYRKIHLPPLGVDRYLDRGDESFKVYKTEIGNIGIHICYDCNFPESARVMALMGADILVLPTNWPEGRGCIPGRVAPTRAYENKVYFVAVNRVGIERGVRFIGSSKIINTVGETLAEASVEDEEIIYCEIKPSTAREKRTVLEDSGFTIDLIGDRRPDFYGKITENK